MKIHRKKDVEQLVGRFGACFVGVYWRFGGHVWKIVGTCMGHDEDTFERFQGLV